MAATLPEAYRARYPRRGRARPTSSASMRCATMQQRAIRLYRARERPARAVAAQDCTSAAAWSRCPTSVPVLENFGFTVLEEIPTALPEASPRNIHEFPLDHRRRRRRRRAARAAPAMIERGDRLACFAARPRMTPSTSWSSAPVLTPRSVVWLRAWFRYIAPDRSRLLADHGGRCAAPRARPPPRR